MFDGQCKLHGMNTTYVLTLCCILCGTFVASVVVDCSYVGNPTSRVEHSRQPGERASRRWEATRAQQLGLRQPWAALVVLAGSPPPPAALHRLWAGAGGAPWTASSCRSASSAAPTTPAAARCGPPPGLHGSQAAAVWSHDSVCGGKATLRHNSGESTVVVRRFMWVLRSGLVGKMQGCMPCCCILISRLHSTFAKAGARLSRLWVQRWGS